MRRHGPPAVPGSLRASARRRPTSRRGESGSVSVEFALVLIPFLVLVFGMLQYSTWFFSAQSGAAAAREAARRSAVGDLSCTELATRARQNAELESGTVTVTRSYSRANSPIADAAIQVGDDVNVVVAYTTLDFHFPFIPMPGEGGVRAKVSETATARVETKTSKTVSCQ